MPTSWIQLLPLILQGAGTLLSAGESGRAGARAGRAQGLFEEEMDRYTKMQKELDKYRKYLGGVLSLRASQRPFYSATWGRYGKDRTPEFTPPK